MGSRRRVEARSRRRRRRGLGALAAGALLAILLPMGCAEPTSFRAEGPMDLGGTLAVVPFESLAGDPNAGLILADLMSQELAARELSGLRSQEEVNALLAPLAGEVVPPKKLGALLDADYLLVGSVTEYRYRQGLGTEPVVAVSLRLLDGRTGEAVWGVAREAMGRSSLFREQSVSEVARKLCAMVANDLLEARSGDGSCADSACR